MERIPELPVREVLKSILEKEGIDFEKVCDLREEDPERVVGLLNKLTEADTFIFHGTPETHLYEVLEPRQGHDVERESGQKEGVYGTGKGEESAVYATYNKLKLRKKYESFLDSIGTVTEDGVEHLCLGISPEVYKDYENGEVFDDGSVYILDRKDFKKSEGTRDEWCAPNQQKPESILLISKDVGINVLGDNIFMIPQDEVDDAARKDEENLG